MNKDSGSTLKTVADSAQHNAEQIVGSVELAFPEQRKRLVEQAC